MKDNMPKSSSGQFFEDKITTMISRLHTVKEVLLWIGAVSDGEIILLLLYQS